jgi:hypothetical protein
MDIASLFGTAAAVITALGGGGAIVWSLSNYLGKIWANRLMESERHDHERALAQLRADLAAQNSRALEELRATLSLDLTKRLGAHQDKVLLYRSAADLVVEIVVPLAAAQQGMKLPADKASEVVLNFERKRLQAYAYLAMFAPQTVMDKYDAVVDYLLDVLSNEKPYDFGTVRKLGIGMLNEIRVDLGIDPTQIEYRGERR